MQHTFHDNHLQVTHKLNGEGSVLLYQLEMSRLKTWPTF